MDIVLACFGSKHTVSITITCDRAEHPFVSKLNAGIRLVPQSSKSLPTIRMKKRVVTLFPEQRWQPVARWTRNLVRASAPSVPKGLKCNTKNNTNNSTNNLSI